MIIITTIEDMYSIGFFEDQDPQGILCIFCKHCLPPALQAPINSLPAFRDKGESFYWLNDREQQKVRTIFRKLLDEERSDYLFSKQLQLVYLIELLHYLLKLHQPATQPLRISSN